MEQEQTIPQNNEEITEILDDIRENTEVSWKKSLFQGLMYGAGVVIGTICAIAVLGWTLSFFGVIPGIDTLVAQLQEILKSKY